MMLSWFMPPLRHSSVWYQSPWYSLEYGGSYRYQHKIALTRTILWWGWIRSQWLRGSKVAISSHVQFRTEWWICKSVEIISSPHTISKKTQILWQHFSSFGLVLRRGNITAYLLTHYFCFCIMLESSNYIFYVSTSKASLEFTLWDNLYSLKT